MSQISIDQITSELESINKSKFAQTLIHYASNCETAYTFAKNLSIPKHVKLTSKKTLNYKRPTGLVFTGMGGSGIAGAYLTQLGLDRISIPIINLSGVPIPRFVDSSWLSVNISYSGNTQETLENYQEALNRGLMILNVTSGGKLSQESRKIGLPLIKLPSGYLPRMAFPYLLFSTLAALIKMDVFPAFNEIPETIRQLDILKDRGPEMIKNQSQIAIADKIKGKAILVLGYGPMSVVAYRLKCQINENAKALSWAIPIPESAHNEVVGWHQLPNFSDQYSSVFIRDKNEPPHIQKRINLMQQLLNEKNVDTHEIWCSGDKLITRMMTATYLCDLTSFYLAILTKVDPTTTPEITWIKKKLSS